MLPVRLPRTVHARRDPLRAGGLRPLSETDRRDEAPGVPLLPIAAHRAAQAIR